MSLSLDFTGSNSANYVNAEIQSVGPSEDDTIYVYPKQGPFFQRNLIITYTSANGGSPQPLQVGLDYNVGLVIPEIGSATNQQIYGAIILNNNNLNGTLSISYQALGGNWSINAVQIFNFINGNWFNSNTQIQALVAYPPLLKADKITPLILNSSANITLAQGLNPIVGLGVAFIRQIENGSKNVGVSRQPVLQTVTGTSGGLVGSTQSGAVSLTIKNNGSIAIVVAGGTLNPGDQVSWDARPGETLASISYEVPNNGTALITSLI